MPAIFLIGFRGSGKSALGKGAAEILNLKFIDLDEVFREEFGEISEFITNNGWQEFREREAEILQNFAGFSGIIATGGGIIEREENRAFLKLQKTIFIDVPLEEIVFRLTKKMGNRPQLEAGKDLETEIRENLARRLPLYKKSAKLIFQPDIQLSKAENSAKLANFIANLEARLL